MNQSVKSQPWVLSATLSQSGKAKRPCRRQAQISGESWFVSEEFKAGKASSCAPGTRSAHVSRPRVPDLQQWVPQWAVQALQEAGDKEDSPGEWATARPGNYAQGNRCCLLLPEQAVRRHQWGYRNRRGKKNNVGLNQKILL